MGFQAIQHLRESRVFGRVGFLDLLLLKIVVDVDFCFGDHDKDTMYKTIFDAFQLDNVRLCSDSQILCVHIETFTVSTLSAVQEKATSHVVRVTVVLLKLLRQRFEVEYYRSPKAPNLERDNTIASRPWSCRRDL